MTIIRLCHGFSSKKFAKFSWKSFCRSSLVTASSGTESPNQSGRVSLYQDPAVT